jgi:hypothetical protein
MRGGATEGRVRDAEGIGRVGRARREIPLDTNWRSAADIPGRPARPPRAPRTATPRTVKNNPKRGRAASNGGVGGSTPDSGRFPGLEIVRLRARTRKRFSPPSSMSFRCFCRELRAPLTSESSPGFSKGDGNCISPA